MTALLSDIELFRRLVGFDSTSANSNLSIAGFMADYLDRDGVELLRVDSEDGQKTNLVAWFGPAAEADRGGLVLSGHTDVVPAGEPGWESEPFTLTERNGRFFARGASDMKGFLALAMNAAASAGTLRKPLVLIFTYDEEVGTLGAQRFASHWPPDRPLPRNALIGEPTSLRIVSAHKGHMKIRINVFGKSAHSAYPHLGHNAIERAAAVVTALATLRQELSEQRARHSDRFDEVPFVTLNTGAIHGGSAINVIPERCEIELGIRLLPEMESGAMVAQVRAAVGRVLAPEEFQLEVVSDSPPMLLDRSARVHRELAQMVNQQSLEAVSFATDAGWLQRLGLECVLFGPGSIQVAHRANEFMPRAEFERAAQILPRIIERFCMAV